MLAATVDCEGSVKQKGCGVISRIYGAEGLGEREKKEALCGAARTGLKQTHLTERNTEQVSHKQQHLTNFLSNLRPLSFISYIQQQEKRLEIHVCAI